MRSFFGLAAGLAAVVVLAGCGGSSSSSSALGSASTKSATPVVSGLILPRCDPEPCTLSRAELAAKVDALCVRGNAAVNQADARFEQATDATDYANAAAAMEAALLQFPPYEDTIQGITPPAQDQAAFTRYVDLTRRIHGLSTQIVAAGRARNTPEIVRLSHLVREEFATRTRTAVDLGAKHCDA